MPRKTKNAPKDLPSIPAELIDQFVKGPMTAEAVQDAAMAFKKDGTVRFFVCKANNARPIGRALL